MHFQDGSTSLPKRVAGLLAVGFDGQALSEPLRGLIDRGVSGVILFSRNIGTAQQVSELVYDIKSYASRPFYVGVDQEGGVVQRLRSGFSRVPAMSNLGRTGDISLARDVGQILGAELRAVGIDVDFAPVIDVDTNPLNPVIGDRAFSSDPEVVAKMGVALAQGLESMGVASCGKHFPGHGDTHLDSHLALPILRHDLERLKSVELVPFAHWAAAQLASIMTAHVVFEALDSALPATMSSALISGLLRTELGYEGLVISDDLEMKAVRDHFGAAEAAVMGLIAGVDHFLVCKSAEVALEVLDELEAAVQDGRVSGARLAEAERRTKAFLARWAEPAQRCEPDRLMNILATAEAARVLAKIPLTMDSALITERTDPTERDVLRE